MKIVLIIIIALIAFGCVNSSDNSPNESDEVELLGLNKVGLSKDSLLIQNPYKTIKRIFDNYNKYQESTDSRANLDSLKRCLKVIESSDVDEETLTLIINVWMYYTVTDFPTRKYTKNALLVHKEKSIQAIKQRMKNKKEWEVEDGAPFSELPILLEVLENE